MTIESLRAIIQSRVSSFFNGIVYFSEAKMDRPPEPYITIGFGNYRRSFNSVRELNTTTQAQSQGNTMQCDLTVDLYTNGRKVGDIYQNTADSDMLDFINYMESDDTVEWMETNDIFVSIVDGSFRSLSELGDVNFRYRSQAIFRIYFIDVMKGKYGMGGKTLPNPSGGGTQQQVSDTVDWFDSAEIEEEEDQ